MLKKKSRLAVGLVVTALALTGALASAAWLATGSGNGSAKATSSQSLTLADASASPSAQLYPGASGDVKIKISNPNGFAVQLRSITGNGAITSDKGAACDAATGVTYSAPSAAALDVPAYLIAANASDVVITLPNAVAMSNASDDACQGATFTIPVSVSGRSAVSPDNV